MKALYHRAHKICSNKQPLDKQISQIKTFMPWNSYPKRVQNFVIKRLDTNKSHSRLADNANRKKIWLDLSSVKWSVLAHLKSQPRGQIYQAQI